MINKMKVLIVGAGLSGSVCARELAEAGHTITIIDKRPHIAGNCYDYINKNGVLVPKYGPHFFHTNVERVWKYVQKFSAWNEYTHKVKSFVDGKFVPMPVNINTINDLCNVNLTTSDEMRKWLNSNTKKILEPKNSEEVALNNVGLKLYEKLFKPYTIKQWNKEPKDLHPSIMSRIPINYGYTDVYFKDAFQYIPEDGFTKMFDNMLSHTNITVKVDIEYNHNMKKYFDLIIFTGKIDEYFDECELPKLEYRSLDFVNVDFKSKTNILPTTSVNLPQDLVFTRVTEPKIATMQDCPNTTLIYEIPRTSGEAYYPVITDDNLEIYQKYKLLGKSVKCDNIYFVGRLAQFKYFNMDLAILNALTFIDILKEEGKA